MTALLEISNLSKYFGGLAALTEISFGVARGSITGLIGPNGAGKTTCLNVATGFLKPNKGKVFFRGEDVSGLAPHQIAAKGIARTFQDISLFPNLTAWDNVVMGTYLRMGVNLLPTRLSSRKSRSLNRDLSEQTEKILTFMGMERERNILARNLSHGEQRKLGIAIALAVQPDLLCLDEPSVGMNPTESLELAGLIKTFQAREVTILIIAHDMKLVMGVCEKIIVLNYGMRIAEGTPEEITENTEVMKAYLGKRSNHDGR